MSCRIDVLAGYLSHASFWHDPSLDISSIGSRAHGCLIQADGFAESAAELANREVQGVVKDTAKAERTKAKADDLVRNAQLPEALSRYTTALKLASSAGAAGRDLAAKLYCNRALCLLRAATQQSSEQAADDCTAAISLDPGYAKAYYRRALARQKHGCLKEAAEDAQEAAVLSPDWPETQELLAQLQLSSSSAAQLQRPSQSTAAAQGYGKGLRVQEIPGEGRALVAAEVLQPGTEVMRDLPFAALLHKEQHDTLCWRCFKPLPEAKHFCRRCQLPRYCSYDCRQQDDWHAPGLCGTALIKVFPADVLIGALIAAKLKQGARHCAKIRQLHKHMTLEMFQERPMLIRLAASCLVADVWNETVSTHPGPTDCPRLEAQEILEALLIHSTNGTAIVPRDHSGPDTQLGPALYPHTCMLNHGCSPTVMGSYQGAQHVIRTISGHQPGDLLRFCYGPQVGEHLTSYRQEALHRQYRFTCRCADCLDGAHKDTQLVGWRCTACSAAVLPQHAADPALGFADLVCERCGLSEPKAAVMRREQELHAEQQTATQAFEAFSSARMSDAPQHIQMHLAKDALLAVKHAQKVQRKILTSTHRNASSSHLRLAGLYTMLGNKPQLAAKHALKHLDIMRAQYPAHSPTVATSTQYMVAFAEQCTDPDVVAACRDALKAAKHDLQLLYGDAT